MKNVDPLYIKYKKLENDINASDSERNKVLLDFLSRDYYNEPFHLQVFEHLMVLGLSVNESAEKLSVSEEKIRESINASATILAFWKTNQSILYDTEKSKEKHPDVILIDDEEMRIYKIELSNNQKEMQLSLLDDRAYVHTFYYYLSDSIWHSSEFNGKHQDGYWGKVVSKIDLPNHPLVQEHIRKMNQ